MNARALPFGLYILAREDEWARARELGYWHTPALDRDGFIHAASHEQVPGVYARHFADHTKVFVLKLDEAALVDYLRWDPHPVTGELYPHIGAPIPLECVERVYEWPLDH